MSHRSMSLRPSAHGALSRRSLLSAGAAAAALPLARLLEKTARAAGTDLLNFVCIYHPHGISAEYWAMRSGETEATFDLSYPNCSLMPFDDPTTYGKSFRDKILIIEGIDHL